MICHACRYYVPASAKNPISPVCIWRPNYDDSDTLKLILQAPAYSRAIVMATPAYVYECPQFTEAQ